MPDMLVKLLDLPKEDILFNTLEDEGVIIHRALAPDKFRMIKWVEENSSIYAAGECDKAFSNNPISCYVASKAGEILGYACYDSTAPNFFGPTRVLDKYRGKGIGKALLFKSLYSMREAGYVYAIIGGVGPAEFYTKAVGATLIPDSMPGIYKHFLRDGSKKED